MLSPVRLLLHEAGAESALLSGDDGPGRCVDVEMELPLLVGVGQRGRAAEEALERLEGGERVLRELPGLPLRRLTRQAEERGCDSCKVFHIPSEVVDESEEGLDLLRVAGRRRVPDGLGLVHARQDAVGGEGVAQVRRLLRAEVALGEVELEVVLAQPGERGPEVAQVVVEVLAVDEDVVDVREDVGQAPHGDVHEPGEGRRAAGEAHGAGGPLELAHARDREGGVGAG